MVCMHAYAWLPSGRVLDHKCVLVITNNLTCIVCSYALRPGAYTSPSLARIDDASEHSTPLQRRTNWKKAMALLSDNSIETDPCLIYWSTHKGHVHALQMETPCTNTRSRPGLATVVSAKKDTTVFYILLAGNSPAPQARHVTSCSLFTMLFSPSTSTEKKLTLTEKTPLPSSSSRSLTKRGLLQTAQPPPSPPSSLPLPLCPPLPRCAGVLASSSISAFHLPSLDAAAR